MFRISLFLLLMLILSACAGATPTASPKPTNAPSAPTTGARATMVVPPQPTSAPIVARAATPFISPTFAPIITVPAAATAVPPAPTASAPRTATPATAAQPPAGPPAPGVATGVRSEVKIEFVNTLASAEEADDLGLALRRIAGILAVSGNETAITVVYDAGLILPNQIRARLASMGHPTKP